MGVYDEWLLPSQLPFVPCSVMFGEGHTKSFINYIIDRFCLVLQCNPCFLRSQACVMLFMKIPCVIMNRFLSFKCPCNLQSLIVNYVFISQSKVKKF